MKADMETSEVPTKYRRGDRKTLPDGTVLEFIEAEIEGEKWAVISGPSTDAAKGRS